MDPITIIFVDDHPLIRKAWTFLLNQDPRFKVVGESEGADQAIDLTEHLCPDIVIMDVRLRGISGIEATRLIRKSCPKVKVIGLSFYNHRELAQAMIRHGAMGFLTKNSPPEEIFKAIVEVHQGKIYVCQEMTREFD
jgi:DNA-binding NarL/FixJ family response regulator